MKRTISSTLLLMTLGVGLWTLDVFSQAANFQTIKHLKDADPNSEVGMSINNSGTLLVDYQSLSTRGYQIAKVYATGYIPVRVKSIYAFGMNLNNVGEVGGTAWINNQLQGFLIRKGGELLTYTFPGKSIDGGGTINDYSHKAFSIFDLKENKYSGAWRDHAGHNFQIDYPGAQWTDAIGINNSDEIVGDWFDGASNRGYLYSKGQFYSIDVPGAIGTYPTCINNLGHIGGDYIDSQSVPHGFVLKDGSFITVDFPVSADVELIWTMIGGLNDKGKLAGTYLIANPSLVNGLERFAFTASY